MPDMSFGDFLNKMVGETDSNGPKKKRPQPQTENQRPKKKKPLYEEEENNEEPKKKKEEPKKKENSMPQNSSSSDDIVVKALDYSTRFLKVIYDNFKNEKDRQVVLQSIRSAIDLALGGQSVTAQNISSQNASTQQPKRQSKPEQQTQSTNENVEVHMNDLSGQEVDINPKQYYQQQTQEVQDGSYRKGLNLGLKVRNDGKQEVDLSNVSQHDIHEMRVLAGVDPEQKKREQKQQGFGAGDIENIERGDNSGE